MIDELKLLLQLGGASSVIGITIFGLVKVLHWWTKSRLTEQEIFERKLKAVAEQEKSVSEQQQELTGIRSDLIRTLMAKIEALERKHEDALAQCKAESQRHVERLEARCRADTAELERRCDVLQAAFNSFATAQAQP